MDVAVTNNNEVFAKQKLQLKNRQGSRFLSIELDLA
jgi:hypothetical protein